MIKNNRHSPPLALNPFKGKAGLVVRLLLSDFQRSWTGRALAKELGLSQAWVNRLLDSLAKQGLLQRNAQGTKSQTKLLTTYHLLKKWTALYSIDQNEQHFYYHPSQKPLDVLRSAQAKEGFLYALTGYAAANEIKQSTYHAAPMVYLWPKYSEKFSFDQLLRKLENVYGFIPVTNQANVIILKPTQKEAAFYQSMKIKNKPIVSPVQLFLDLFGLQRGPTLISELDAFWKEHHLEYEI